MYVCIYIYVSRELRQAASQLLELLTIQIAKVTLTSLGVCNIAGSKNFIFMYVCIYVFMYMCLCM